MTSGEQEIRQDRGFTIPTVSRPAPDTECVEGEWREREGGTGTTHHGGSPDRVEVNADH